MKARAKVRGKRKASAKVPVHAAADSQVKLKKTTRLMLWMAHFFKREFYTQKGRNTKAEFYREGRRFGVLSNRELMNIEEPGLGPSAIEFYEGMMDLLESGRLGPCSDDPPAPFTPRHIQESDEADVAPEAVATIDEDSAPASAAPQNQESNEDHAVELDVQNSSELSAPKSRRRNHRTATRQLKQQLSLGFE